MAELIKLPNNYTHTRLLGELLQIAHAGPNEKKEVIEKNESTYRQLGFKYDGKATNLRELLMGTEVDKTSLLTTEINQTLIEGAEPAKCMRQAIPIFQMKSKSEIVSYGEAGTYAEAVAEGAEIPIDTQDLTPITFTAVKRGVRPLITKELVKFAKFDIIAMEIKKAGLRLENALNRACIDEFLTTCAATATLCTDFGNAGATPLTHLDEAVTTIKNSGFQPNKVIFHPSCTSAYRLAVQGLYFDGVGSDVIRGQGLPRIYGLDAYECGVSDNNSSYVWGWGTDNYIGGVVNDSTASQMIGMVQDIEVEEQYDPIRQLHNLPCTMMFDVQCLNPVATNLLQY
jgi:hypothetical protein